MAAKTNHTDAVKKFRAKELEAASRFDAELRAARDDGVSWRDLAEASGLTVSQLRWRVTNGGDEWEYVKERREGAAEVAAKREADRLAAINAGQRPKPGTEPLTVAQATEQLGVSRPTTYAWLHAGRIAWSTTSAGVRVERDEQGRIVVGLPGEHEPLTRK